MGLIKLAETWDDHAFQNSQQSLSVQRDWNVHSIQDQGRGRKQIILAVCIVGLSALVAGTLVTVMLILAGQYQLAQVVMIGGLTTATGLLGGAGLTKILSDLGKGGR